MALIITDNSPSAGYIAWTGLVITYKSVNYNVNDGNSNKRYIWWDLDNPNDLQESDTMPTMTIDDCIEFVNINGSSRLWGNRKVPSYVVEEFSNGWIPINYTFTRNSADDPTYVLKVTGFDVTSVYSIGMKIKFTQNAATVYGIITKIELSGSDTLITVYCGTDYDVLDTGSYAITSPYYSMVKAPLGFPLDPIKWTVQISDTTSRLQASPTIYTVYNPGSLSIDIPIGSWKVEYHVALTGDRSGDYQGVACSLSTANNSVSDAEFNSSLYINASGASRAYEVKSVSRYKDLLLAAKTTYYMVVRTDYNGMSNIGFSNDYTKLIIRAVCNYI